MIKIGRFYEIYKNNLLQSNCIYIIKNLNTNYYKIGITDYIDRRFRQLELQSGCKLEMIDWYLLDLCNNLTAKEIEKILHKKYKKYNVIGEWFDIDHIIDNVLECYINLCDNGKTQKDY